MPLQEASNALSTKYEVAPLYVQVDKDLRNFKRDSASLLQHEKSTGSLQDSKIVER